MSALLSLRNLCVSYGPIPAVREVSLDVPEGGLVTLIGANGAGKTTILRAISGLLPWTGGIVFENRSLARMAPEKIVEAGIAHVPEGRGLFANLTVMENLQLAAWTIRRRAEIAQRVERVFGLFPRLAERTAQPAGTLSGGEQQMLALGRALMSRARLLLLDEPSMGLAPTLVREVFATLTDLNRDGATILLVEQNARRALKIAQEGHVLETGRVVLSGTGQDLLSNPRIHDAYLGG